MNHIHPLIVHFTIGLLAVGVVADLLRLFNGKQNLLRISTYLLTAGTLCAVIAVVSGGLAAELLEVPPALQPLVDGHRASGQVTLAAFLLFMILRMLFQRFRWFGRPVRWLYFAVGLLSLLLLFRTGFLGGEMVYGHGLGLSAKEKTPISKPSFEK